MHIKKKMKYAYSSFFQKKNGFVISPLSSLLKCHAFHKPQAPAEVSAGRKWHASFLRGRNVSGGKKEVTASLVCTRLEITVCSGQMQMSQTRKPMGFSGFLWVLFSYFRFFFFLGKPLVALDSLHSLFSDQWRFSSSSWSLLSDQWCFWSSSWSFVTLCLNSSSLSFKDILLLT